MNQDRRLSCRCSRCFKIRSGNLHEEFFCENGQYTFAGEVVNDHEDYGLLTFPQIIENSSNVGMIKIAERIGPSDCIVPAVFFGFGDANPHHFFR
ncbi:MAG: hypothetical protein CM1200mP10_30900 [Candidatus Neomarinimicrobiota bacterium]|nr:MAG: hypothetical protein CM1200mP10_30900 [Candidatus Neomarinimicrobiota bacterium]